MLLVKVNGQFTPPCATRPLADQLSVDPEIGARPPPVTVMLPAQVAVNDTFALDGCSGRDGVLTLPHPVGGRRGGDGGPGAGERVDADGG